LEQFKLDETDKTFLQLVQKDFPITKRPWDVLAEKLGISYECLMDRVNKLFEQGIVRRFGPVLETDKVGLSARTLILMKVPRERVEEVASIVNGFEAVTHNYERENEYNLWFTLITSNQKQLNSSLQEILDATKIPETNILDLPVTRKFKIKVSYEFR
jgi:DNA-binding Lrp family transcriptional regulator